MPPKRKSGEDFQSPRAKKGTSSSSAIRPDLASSFCLQALSPDYYSNLPVDCIIEVCKHLDREWIDELSRANRKSYQAAQAKCLEGIKLRGAELDIYKACFLKLRNNSTGFCFTLTVTKKIPRKTGKRIVANSELYIYHVEDNGRKEQRYRKLKSEVGLDNERSYNEKKPTLDMAIPPKFIKAFKEIPDKYALRKFCIRSVKIDGGFIEVLVDLIDPSSIEHFEYDKNCTIAKEITEDEYEQALEWLNALSDKSSARVAVMKNALTRAKATGPVTK